MTDEKAGKPLERLKKLVTDDKQPAKKDIMRDNIARISFELFVEQGYEKTTMRQIALKAMILNGSLYNAFKNKSEIFEYIAMKTLSNLFSKSSALCKDTDDLIFKVNLPAVTALYVASKKPEIAELLHEVFSSWESSTVVADEYIQWIQDLTKPSGINIVGKNPMYHAMLMMGVFDKMVHGFRNIEQTDIAKDIYTYMLIAFSLFQFPVHGIADLVRRYLELMDAIDIETSLNPW